MCYTVKKQCNNTTEKGPPHQIKNCGNSSNRKAVDRKLALQHIIITVPLSSQPPYVINIGTAEGFGTTVALYDASREHCADSIYLKNK